MTIKRLFLDMDGVLMNYEAAIEAAGVVRYRDGAHWISRPRSEWPPEMIAADKAYVECMLSPDFWRSILPMDDAGELWTFCAQFYPEILTAAPTDRPGETQFARIRYRITQDKRASIRDHFDTLFPLARIHVCLRHEKADFAAPGRVLVDDTPGNCAEWEAKGGTAILHTDAASTIRALRSLMVNSTEKRILHACICNGDKGGHTAGCPLSNEPVRMVGGDRSAPMVHFTDTPPAGMAATFHALNRCGECNAPAPSHTIHCNRWMREGLTGKVFQPPALRPRNRAERKAEPIHSGVMLYFPDAIAAVSRISKSGNDVHNPGEPLHWARGKSMDQMDAAARHMLTLEAVDPETGEVEAAANAWRALAQLQLIEEKRLAAAGIRPYSGITP